MTLAWPKSLFGVKNVTLAWSSMNFCGKFNRWVLTWCYTLTSHSWSALFFLKFFCRLFFGPDHECDVSLQHHVKTHRLKFSQKFIDAANPPRWSTKKHRHCSCSLGPQSTKNVFMNALSQRAHFCISPAPGVDLRSVTGVSIILCTSGFVLLCFITPHSLLCKALKSFIRLG